MNYLFFALSNAILIIAGIVCIAIASRWPRHASRSFFVAATGLLLVAAPAFGLLSTWLIASGFFIPRMFYVIQALSQIVIVLGAFLMIGFAARAPSVDGPATPLHVPESVSGPSWRTRLDRSEIRENSSRRNLAFVIDITPLLLSTVAGIYGAAIQSSYLRDEMQILLATAMSWTSLFGIVGSQIYLVFKDAVGGRSIGKRMLDCRVVVSDTGVPVGLTQSALRNFVYIFPFACFVELVVSLCRSDGKRLGDLIAETTVVSGSPDFIDGHPVSRKSSEVQTHPLD